MHSASYVAQLITDRKAAGDQLQSIAWDAALACEGWAYVFGSRGELCTPANRRARDYIKHPTIKTKCKNFDGSGSCSGCKWFPGDKRTRIFDCRGFTYWILLQVYGWKLMGAGATSQWKMESNWTAKGEISTIPANTLVCLFVANGSKMEHTGFGFNNETVECSNGVQHFTSRKSKWTHWGIPACVGTETTQDTRPTLRRGSKGTFVTLAQTMLIQQGYDCGKCGADGDFGKDTEAAVRRYQADHALTVDGIIGQSTWDALDNAAPVLQYTVTIPHLSKSQADALVSQYPGAKMSEGG